MIMKLDTIPQSTTGEPLARETEKSDSAPRDLRSLLLQALANAPIAGWVPVAPGVQRPLPDDPGTIHKRGKLLDQIEQSNGEIDLTGEELTLLERCVAAEFTVGSVQIFRAMRTKEKESEDG
jgi:hypothetical protein